MMATESTVGLKGYVRRAPPWMVSDRVATEAIPAARPSSRSGLTTASRGNSSCPMLRMATVLGPRGVPITALKVRRAPSSTYTRILWGVLSGPCQSSTSASRGRPSVFNKTCTDSMAGLAKDQVRRDPPCTITGEELSQISARSRPPMAPARGPPVPTSTLSRTEVLYSDIASCVVTGALAAGAKALAPVKATSVRAAENFMVFFIIFSARVDEQRQQSVD
mmetsp:Transcript_12791/g.19177  ORF Transcript_12791/g.19177 Transcript_12791/m.19177 type:complete len:221 (-) Transcript_12791:32-694(-)